MSDTDLIEAHRKVMAQASKQANVNMRELFMSSEDTALGAAIAQSRRKGSDFAAVLARQWSPIRWMRGRPGFIFEINPNDLMAMGEDAYDERIDEAVLAAVLDAIGDNVEFVGALVRDVALGGETPDIYEVEARSWASRMMRWTR